MPDFHHGLLAPMPHLGMGELLLILVIVLIIFGASRVPRLGDALGRGIRNFRRSLRSSGEHGEDGEKSERPPGGDPPD